MISIIVAHYKTPGLLTLCLESLQSACRAIEEESEIIVIDGETEPEHAMIVSDVVPEARFIGVDENIGYAGLVNRGLAEAQGRYRFVLNADIIAQERTLRVLIETMDAQPQIGIAGPQLLGFDGAVQDSRFRFYTLASIMARRTIFGRTPWGRRALQYFVMADQPPTTQHDVDWLLGSALFVRAEAYQIVGGMDEQFFLYFEDVDWCRRMWENEYRVTYVPEAVMHHYHHRASDSGRGMLDALVNPITRIHLRSGLHYWNKYRHRSFPR